MTKLYFALIVLCFIMLIPQVRWALFGNDEDTIYGPPWFNAGKRTVWVAVKWWVRNPFHNLCFHVINWPGGPIYDRYFSGWLFYIGWRGKDGAFGIKLRRELPPAAMIILAACLLWSGLADAHGTAEWIQRGGYKNAAGELCCGERDCFELKSEDVQVTPQGYRVKLGGVGLLAWYEVIPFSEATPSPTGTYWRCQWGGARKCFFAPPGAV